MATVTGWTTIGILRQGVFTTRAGVKVRNVFCTYEATWDEIHSVKAPSPYGGWRNTGLQFLLRDGSVINAALYSAGPLNRSGFADNVLQELRSQHERCRSDGRARLSCPRRDGTTTRWLSESEVADAYRDRFAGAREQVVRIATVASDGIERVRLGESEAWVAVSLVPNVPGAWRVDTKNLRTAGEILTNAPGVVIIQSRLRQGYMNLRAGPRRGVYALHHDDEGHPTYGYVEVHEDGSAFVGADLARQVDAPRDGEPDRWAIYRAMAVQSVLDQIAIAVTHAVQNAGCSGDALIRIEMRANIPVELRAGRSFFDDSGPPRSSVSPQTHTISLDDASTHRGQAVVAHLLLTDLFQGFGVAECPNITGDGAFRLPYFETEARVRLQAYAQRGDIEVVDTAVE